MGTVTERIQVKITQDGAKAVRRDIEGVGAGADKAGSALGNFARIAKAAVAAAAVRETIRLADSYTDLSNKIRFATSSEREMISVREELFRVANQNRASIETTADVYGKLRLSTQALGLSQNEVIELTDTLQKATVLSGASAESAANSLRQLGQGMASGALRGDELNSVLENTPYIAQVIAESLGKDIGAIRKMGAEGKITGKIIADAFKGAREEIVDKFGKRIPTVTESFTVMGNVLTQLVGKVDDATGASAGLAGSIIDISKSLDKATPDLAIFMKTLSGFDDLKSQEGIIERIFHGIVGEDNDGMGAIRSWSVLLAAVQDQIYFTVRAFEKLATVATSPIQAMRDPSVIGDMLDAMGKDFTNTSGPYQKRLMEEFAKADQMKLGTGYGRKAGTDAPGDPLDAKGDPSSSTADEAYKATIQSLYREEELLRMSNSEREIAIELDKAKAAAGASLTEYQAQGLEIQIRANHALEASNKLGAEKHASLAQILGELTTENGLLKLSNEERAIAEGLLRAQESAHGRLTVAQLAQVETQLRKNQAIEVENRQLDEINERIDKQLELEQDAMKLEQETQSTYEETLRSIITERELWQLTNQEREIAVALLNAQAAAQGRLTDEQMKNIEAELRTNQSMGMSNEMPGDFEGATKFMDREFIQSMRTFGQEMAIIFGPGGTLQQGLEGVVGSLTDAIGYSIAFGQSWNDTAKAIENIGRSIVAEIISALIRIPIQMGINAVISSAIRAKETSEAVAQAAVVTAAGAAQAGALAAVWSTPAALVSAATFGAAAAAGTASIAGSIAAVKAMSATTAVGFEDGGYTGSGGRSSVAGLVHGQEFVLHADATRRYRADAEAMNAGTYRRNGSGSPSVNVIVNNNAPGVQVETRQLDEQNVEMIVRRLAPQAVADDLNSSYSKVGKAMTRTTTAKRTRA